MSLSAAGPRQWPEMEHAACVASCGCRQAQKSMSDVIGAAIAERNALGSKAPSMRNLYCASNRRALGVGEECQDANRPVPRLCFMEN